MKHLDEKFITIVNGGKHEVKQVRRTGNHILYYCEDLDLYAYYRTKVLKATKFLAEIYPEREKKPKHLNAIAKDVATGIFNNKVWFDVIDVESLNSVEEKDEEGHIKLPKVIYLTGRGPQIRAVEILAHEHLRVYKTESGGYEVIKVKYYPEEKIFGKWYPKREAYPNSEDWGTFGWSFTNEKNAINKFETLKKYGSKMRSQYQYEIEK